jgi:hypothetical protein
MTLQELIYELEAMDGRDERVVLEVDPKHGVYVATEGTRYYIEKDLNNK